MPEQSTENLEAVHNDDSADYRFNLIAYDKGLIAKVVTRNGKEVESFTYDLLLELTLLLVMLKVSIVHGLRRVSFILIPVSIVTLMICLWYVINTK